MTMADLADDALAIANLKAAYCAAADLCATDPDAARAAMAALFTADAQGDYGAAPLAGGAAIAGFLSAGIAQNSNWMLHMLHSPRIEVSGDTARAQWTVLVHADRRDGSGVQVITGRYHDTLRREGAGWRIATLRFERIG